MAVRSLLLELAAVPAPSGDEAPLRRLIMEKIRQQEGHETLEVDGLGNLRVDTGLLGRGLPGSWLFLLPMDDPTFAVSGRLPRGWLQVVSLARPPLSPSFIRHVAGSEVWVMTAGGAVPGLFALPSIHLQGGRPSFPPAASTVHLVVDVGAEPGEEGVQQPAAPRLLDRVVPRVEPVVLADGSVVGLGVGRRSAAAAAILAAGGGRPLPPLVFVAQSRFAGRGGRSLRGLFKQAVGGGALMVLLQATEGIDGFRIVAPAEGEGAAAGGAAEEGSAAQLLKRQLEAAAAAAAPSSLAFSVQVQEPAPRRPLPAAGAPAGQTLILEYPVRRVDRLAETVHPAVAAILSHLMGGEPPREDFRRRAGTGAPSQVDALSSSWRPPPRLYPADPTHPFSHMPSLIKAAGVSGHEGPVAHVIRRLLPPAARRRLRQDEEGNLLLDLGSGHPHLLFVAHLDETGYRVNGIEADGRLQVERMGGFYDSAVLGRPVQVHLQKGGDVPGVLIREAGRDNPSPAGGEKPPQGGSGTSSADPVLLVERLPAASLRVDLGTRSAGETAALGVSIGDTVTVPKRFQLMGPHRGIGRGVDDRAGCAALLAAVHRLALKAAGKDRNSERILPDGFLSGSGEPRRGQVTFAWVVREEIGLEGSRALAAHLKPDEVYAIDTFVSSDSPLERTFFAEARLGEGAVLRAIDSSNLSPLGVVRDVLEGAQAAGIPVQLGAGRGGNDGSVFTSGAVFDLPLSWPGRYSHSAVEMIDARDHQALVDLILSLMVRAGTAEGGVPSRP